MTQDGGLAQRGFSRALRFDLGLKQPEGLEQDWEPLPVSLWGGGGGLAQGAVPWVGAGVPWEDSLLSYAPRVPSPGTSQPLGSGQASMQGGCRQEPPLPGTRRGALGFKADSLQPPASRKPVPTLPSWRVSGSTASMDTWEPEAGHHRAAPQGSQLVSHQADLPKVEAGALSCLRPCCRLGVGTYMCQSSLQCQCV